MIEEVRGQVGDAHWQYNQRKGRQWKMQMCRSRDPSVGATARLHSQGHAHLDSIANSTLLAYHRRDERISRRRFFDNVMEKGRRQGERGLLTL